MQKGYIITGIMSLGHLKTGFFRLKMDFKKTSGICDNALPKWVKVGKKKDWIG